MNPEAAVPRLWEVNEVSDILEVYAQFVSDEDQLVRRISTCDEITATIIDLMYQQGDAFHSSTVEEILMAIHRVQQDLQTELLHTRLEKAVVAYKQKHGLPLQE